MYQNANAWMIERAEGRERERAERDLQHRVAIAAAPRRSRPTRLRAVIDRLAQRDGRPATDLACCPA
jgi:hypothetical protein